MEPIRPDDDEVRAGTSDTKREEKLSAQREPRDGEQAASDRKPEPSRRPAAGGGGSTRSAGKPGKSAGGGGRGRGGIWAIALVVVAGAAAAGWYQQEQRIQVLEGQLEEADYWARQSKLALARFEGELSETGETLQEKGQSMEEQLTSQDERLDTVDSEIAKLWVVANERNRKRLNDHEAQLESLSTDIDEGEKARETLTASVEKLETEVASRLDEVESDLEKQITALRETGQENASRLTQLDESLAGVDQLVERQLVRFEREQKLTIDGLESRIAALEEATDNLSSNGQLNAVRSELSELERTVASIDSSRAQLTSRLIRLSEEVNELRSRISGQ